MKVKKMLLMLVILITMQGYGMSHKATDDVYAPITNLPTIFIDTENGAAITSKDDYVNAVITVRGAANEEDNITEVPAEIKGRGNSTWKMAKKPYRLKFEDKINFLGNEAKEKNWVLLANYADKTLLRNALAFETARALFNFEFTPSVTFVDVVLNGKNIGSYLLTDQVEVKKSRVSVMEQPTTVVQGNPEITGGYLIEVDGFAEKEISWFKTAKDMKVTIKYPKDDEINASQKNYIQNYTQRMENALFSERFDDPEKGWRHYIDEDSWVNWYIACELFGNSDSWWSTYMYKERGEKFKYGPIWDFDIAFNNDYRIGNATEKFMRSAGCDPKTWIKRWWEDETLQKQVKKRWVEMGAENIKEFMLSYIDSMEVVLDESQKNNYEIWPTLDTRVHYEYSVRGSYEAEVQALREYVDARIRFLDLIWRVRADIDEKVVDGSIIEMPYNHIEQGENIRLTRVQGMANVAITLIDGKVVYSAQHVADANNNVVIDSSSLQAGLYIVVASDARSNVFRGRLLVE